MKPVARGELLDYQTYAVRRGEMLPRILDTKAARRIQVGDVLTFLFENRETVTYQIQEMMRVERIVRETDILHELSTYNELLGGPGELGCTLLIEIDDRERRAEKLRAWLGLPEAVYVRMTDGRKVRARSDPRQRDAERLSSVQFLKFDTRGEAPIGVGCDLQGLMGETTLTAAQREALRRDLFEG